MRVMSYNVRVLRDDADAVVRVVRGARPDILCVQEVPRFGWWRARRAGLARRCGMRVAAGERAGGLAIFVSARVTVVHAEHHALSRVPALHRRALAVAVLDVAGAGRVIAACVHLDLDAAARQRHAAEIGAILAGVHRRHPAPVIVAGDINEGPDGPAWRCLADGRADTHTAVAAAAGYTFPARDPRRRIDAILVSPPLRPRPRTVPPVPEADLVRASDHRPVIADLDYGPPSRPDRDA